MAHPAAFQDKYSITEGLALLPVHTQLMCKHIAYLLGDYPSHDDKNCMNRASAIPLSVCPCAKKDARCFASELNSVSCDGRFLGFNFLS